MRLPTPSQRLYPRREATSRARRRRNRPLRTTEHAGKRQEETFADMIAASAGIILGQRGRGVPVAVLRGIHFTPGDEGVATMLHRPPTVSRLQR